MTRRIAALAVIASLVLSTATAAPGLAQLDEEAGDNGLVFMVPGHFEPALTDEIPPPPAQEAFLTTQQDGEIVLYVIPYSVEDEAPTTFDVDDTTIAIEGQLPGQSIILEPREGTQEDQRCVDETSLEGHEGEVCDCLVVTVDAEEVRGWSAVTVELRGTMVSTGEFLTENYSSVAHVAIHTTMEDGVPGWETADDLSAVATPFLAEDLVDPVP